MAILSVCSCARRMAAQASGEFVFLPHAQAWVFTGEDAPTRQLTWRARYYLDGQSDPTGQPVTFTVCPFCGLDLETRASVVDRIRESEGNGDSEGME